MPKPITDEIFPSELAQDMRDNGVDDEEFIAAVVDGLKGGDDEKRDS